MPSIEENQVRQPRGEGFAGKRPPSRRFPIGRETGKYLFLLALAVALFYWKTLITRQFTLIIGSEAVNQHYAWLVFWVNSIRHGQIPLWDPFAYGGRPFSSEMLPAAYYPLHLVLALIPFNRDGVLAPQLYNETYIASNLLCAYFMFALLREFRLSRFAAFVGACCFALSGLLVGMLWLSYVETGIWLPAIFLFLLRAFRAQSARGAVLEGALGGACLGLGILAGGLHLSILQGIFVATAGIYFAAHQRLPWTARLSARAHWLRAGLLVAAVLAVAAGIGAIQLLPSGEYGKLSLRFINGGPIASTEKIPWDRLDAGMWPQSVISVIFPTGFDGKFSGGEGWTPYIGVFPFLLAVFGVWKCWSNLWVRYLAGLAVLAFVYSLATFSPFYGVLYAVVPYLWTVREASRFLYLASFALAILAAFGLDRFLSQPNPAEWISASRILKWVAISAAIAVFVPGIFTQFSLSIWTCLSLLLILASCGWFAYLLRHPASPLTRVLLAVFILFDLSAFHWLETNKEQMRKSGDQLDQMLSLREPLDFLKRKPGPYRVEVTVAPEPNFGDVYGVPAVFGGGATILTSYSRLVPYRNLLNVQYVVRPASAAEPAPIYQDAHWKVYDNPAAYPRAWVVHQTVVETSSEAVLSRLGDASIDLHRVALLESPLARPLDPDRGAAEPVRFRSYEANRMELEVSAQSQGLLVLSENQYPGWHATVNGRKADIHKVDGGLRGIEVGAGESRVVLDYAPLSFYLGAALTLMTALGLVVGLLFRWRSGAGML